MSRHSPLLKPVRKMTLTVSSIRANAGTQSRATISEATVAEYGEAMIRGDRFPPVTVFQSEEGLILADGFHRVRSAKQAGFDTIAAEIRRGSRLDALRYSLSANHVHGLRRTNDDKRHAVRLALRELSIVDSSLKRLGKDGKFRNLPTERAVSPVPSTVDGGATSLPNGLLNGGESEAHEAALEVAQQLCAIEVSIKTALRRFPAKRAMFLSLIRKVRGDLSLLEREITSPL
jgi:hypothetical protein